MTTLQRSSDRKTANSATAGGNVRIKNAFGILSGSANSCPGATSVCEAVCYAGRIERQYPNVHKVMSANYDALVSMHGNVTAMAYHLNVMVQGFRDDCAKHDAPKEFRIHHDGDFFSLAYAEAWRVVIEHNPDIQFWAYTRSFVPACNVVDILAGIPNLALYLSVDADNVKHAEAVLNAYPTVKVATLARTQADAADMMKDLRPRPGASCPENIKRIPLITPAGGACISCQLCVKGKSDVRFSIGGK